MGIYTEEIRALILAAGLGTRLKPITDDKPKSLVAVNGTPILLKQIDNLHENGVYDITVISGYKRDKLKETVHERYPEIQIIENIDYNITNNMYSAYIGRTAVKGHEFLMMNADVFFDASIIRKLIDYEYSNAIVTDIGRYMEESMKVIEKNGRLTAISKKIDAKDALGTSIDVYKFSAEGGKAFFKKCAEYIEEKKEVKLWSEVALNDILGEIEFKACPLDGRWFEIDDHRDLIEAEKLFADV